MDSFDECKICKNKLIIKENKASCPEHGLLSLEEVEILKYAFISILIQSFIKNVLIKELGINEKLLKSGSDPVIKKMSDEDRILLWKLVKQNIGKCFGIKSIETPRVVGSKESVEVCPHCESDKIRKLSDEELEDFGLPQLYECENDDCPLRNTPFPYFTEPKKSTVVVGDVVGEKSAPSEKSAELSFQEMKNYSTRLEQQFSYEKQLMTKAGTDIAPEDFQKIYTKLSENSDSPIKRRSLIYEYCVSRFNKEHDSDITTPENIDKVLAEIERMTRVFYPKHIDYESKISKNEQYRLLLRRKHIIIAVDSIIKNTIFDNDKKVYKCINSILLKMVKLYKLLANEWEDVVIIHQAIFSIKDAVKNKITMADITKIHDSVAHRSNPVKIGNRKKEIQCKNKEDLSKFIIETFRRCYNG